MFHSLRFRLALVCIGLAVGPLVIAGVIIAVNSFSTLEQQSLELQRKVAESVGSEIRGTIEGWENELVLLDEVYGLGVLELKEQRAILSNTLVHQRAFQEVALLNSEGQEQIRLSRTSVILDDELRNRAGTEEFLLPATSGGTYLGPVRFDDTIREPLATISVPLFDQSSGELVSVLVAESRFKAIWDLLNDLELASGEEVYVIDRAGQVVAHRHPAIVLRGTTIELPEVDGRAEGLSGTDVIVARHNLKLGKQELIVIAEQPASRALQPGLKNMIAVTTVICSVIALAIILVIFTTRRIVRPIEALATSARAISGGDFSQKVEVSSRDEVGQLAGSFNKMTEDLARTTTSIDNLNKEITERKQAEEELRDSEEFRSSLLDGSPIPIIVLAPDTSLTYVNPALEKLTGFTSAEILGRKAPHPWWTEEGQFREAIDLQRTMQSGVGRTVDIFQNRDGERFWVEITAAPIMRDGEFKYYLSTWVDITERKQAEEKARELETLREIERMRTELLANVSHELRTPLASIKGYATILMDYDQRLERDEKRRYLGVIDRATERLVELIDQLLDMSRLEAGMLTVERQPTSIRRLLSEAVAEAKVRSPWHRFTLDLPKRLPRLDIDPKRIRQVVDNLLGNAVKYSDEGTEVIVSARRIGQELLVSVADQGVGIPADELPRVFDRMYHVALKLKPGAGGVGLGLSICKGLVEAHGGRIWIESKVGKGTKCYFTLPLYATAGNDHDEKE